VNADVSIHATFVIETENPGNVSASGKYSDVITS